LIHCRLKLFVLTDLIAMFLAVDCFQWCCNPFLCHREGWIYMI
jgi:hypothetical protein